MKYGEDLIELLFPRGKECRMCGSRQGKRGSETFCRKCLSQLVRIDPGCDRCGKELAKPGQSSYSAGTAGTAGSGDGYGYPGRKADCRECESIGHSFTRARAVGYYTGFLQEAMHLYKFVGRQSLAEPLAELMTAEIYRYPFYRQVQAVVPIPLHRRKLEERGFNQSELLAREVAKLLGLPLVRGLIRGRDTGTQSKLSRGERLDNVRGAFQSVLEGNSLVGKKILLIDDILTTGITCHEGALALLKGGAGEVLVFTLSLGRQKQYG
ncbi:MAG: ComF family protein [Clostridia bacterium]|nr:ComF family protein [Clostridia bacterium]